MVVGLDVGSLVTKLPNQRVEAVNLRRIAVIGGSEVHNGRLESRD
jgi:hypothetical protein